MPKKVKTPGMVTLVAILMFIAGGFNILGCVCGGGSIAMLEAIPDMPRGPGQQDPKAMQRFLTKEVPGYYPVVFGILGIDGLLGIAKIALGIGLLRLNAMARLLTMAVYGFNLLLALASGVYNATILLPAQSRFIAANPAPEHVMVQPIAIGSLVLGILLALAVSITILVVLNLRSTKEAFLAASQPPTEAEDRPASRYEGYDDEDDRPRKRTPKFPGDTGITEQ